MTPTDPTPAGKTPTQTPRTDAVEKQAKQLILRRPFGASTADLLQELSDLYLEHAKGLERFLESALANNEPWSQKLIELQRELAAKDAELTQWQKRCGDLYELAITLKRHAKEAQEMYGIHAEELIEDADNVLGAVNSCGKPVRDAAREGAK